MNLLDLMIEVGVDDKASSEISGIADSAKTKLAGIGTAATAGFAALTAAVGGGVTALLGIEAATEEYRVAQGKLNTAFQTAGYSTDAAKQAYTDLYAVIGDTDTAAEAAQLMAKLSDSQEDLGTWTNIAAGVMGTFGDALPINSLMEAANETSKTSVVTGVLADALNWAGISEDEFNAKLAACGDETERNNLIMDTLSGTYDQAAQSFRDNNSAIMESREGQVKMQESLSKVGEAVTNIKNALMNEFGPAIEDASTKLSDFLNGIDVEATIGDLKDKFDEFKQTLTDLAPAISGVVGAFVGFQVATTIVGIIQSVQAAFTALRAATTGLTLSQIALNIAMAANPFVLIATVIAGVVAALIALWMTNEDFRNAVTSAWEAIKTKATEVWNAVVNFFTVTVPEAINSMLTFFQNLPTNIANFLSQVLTNVQTWVSEMVSKAQQAGSDFLNKVVEFFTQLPGKVQEFLSNVISALATWVSDMVTKAQEAGQQFLEAVQTKFEEVVTFFSELPSKILGAIGDVGSILWDTGASIISGLWNGLKSKWDEVTGWFGSITSQIPDLKGPIEVDAKLLISNGQKIMGGLLDGLEDGWSDIESYLSSRTAEIPLAVGSGYNRPVGMTGANASNNTVINQNFYQPVQSAAEFARAQRKLNNYGLAGQRV